MSKLFILVLLCVVAFAMAGPSQRVEIGYKSSAIGIENNDSGYFQFQVTAEQAALINPGNDLNYVSMIEIVYDKHIAGEQSICFGTEQNMDCDSSDEDFVEHLGADSLTRTYCMPINNTADSYIMSIAGTCEFSTSSNPCVETTDVDIEGARIFEYRFTSTLDAYGCPPADRRRYVPFYQDLDGSNTAMYRVDVDDLSDDGQDGFAYPSMMVDVAAGGEDHYVLLDITDIGSSLLYAVEFHYTFDKVCGDSTYCIANDAMCAWNTTDYENFVFPNGVEQIENPRKGSYASGAIQLSEGSWGVTPYVYKMSTGEVSFRFCGGLGAECASASGLTPSVFLFAILLAFIALMRQF